MNLAHLERKVSRKLGIPVALAACRAETAEHEARAVWRRQAGRFSKPARRRDWLSGRQVLAELFRRLDISDDPAKLRWPHPELSLTHSGGLALAAGSCGTRGLGVDYEPFRPVDPRTTRWFMVDAERCKLRGLDDQILSRTLLVCWTQKEALFKACPANAELVLADIRLSTPGATSGTATVTGETGLEFRFVSLRLLNGIFSVATALSRKSA